MEAHDRDFQRYDHCHRRWEPSSSWSCPAQVPLCVISHPESRLPYLRSSCQKAPVLLLQGLLRPLQQRGASSWTRHKRYSSIYDTSRGKGSPANMIIQSLTRAQVRARLLKVFILQFPKARFMISIGLLASVATFTVGSSASSTYIANHAGRRSSAPLRRSPGRTCWSQETSPASCTAPSGRVPSA